MLLTVLEDGCYYGHSTAYLQKLAGSRAAGDIHAQADSEEALQLL